MRAQVMTIPIDKQVVNYKLAKKLQNLGIVKNSLFCWVPKGKKSHIVIFGIDFIDGKVFAPTTEEMNKVVGKPVAHCYQGKNGYYLSVSGYPEILEKNEADAKARLAIYMHNKKIK